MCRMCGRNTDGSVSRRFIVMRKKGREMQKISNACAKSIVTDSFSGGITFKRLGIKQIADFLLLLLLNE